jgi:hypothetical protein
VVGVGSIVPGDVFVVVLALVVGVCVFFYLGLTFSFPGMGWTFLSNLSYVRGRERERGESRTGSPVLLLCFV